MGADFVVIDRRAWPEHVPLAYEKLQVGRLLAHYDRVLCRQLGVALPSFDWERRYFQTGVMVVARRHAELFTPPRVYLRDPWAGQQ